MFVFTEKYEKIKNFSKICKYDEALQIIQDIEDNHEVSKKNHFLVKLEQSRILISQAKFDDSIAISLECYKNCQIEGFSLISLDFVIECVNSSFRLGKMEKAIEYIDLGHQLITTLPDITQKELVKREAKLGYLYSSILWQKGKYENSLPLVDELLSKQKKFGNREEEAKLLVMKSVLSNAQGQINIGLKCLFEAMHICQENNAIASLTTIYNNIGWIYDRMGKYREALIYLKKSADLISDTENNYLYCSILDNIGSIYRQLGDLEQSQKHLLQAINMGEKIGNNYKLTHYYFNIIRTLLEQMNFEQAQKYLLQFGKIVEIENSKAVIFRYKIAQAIFLKASHRTRDRYKAQTMLLDQVNEENYE